MRIGGLDVGDRRIGIAISDEQGWTAQGLTVLTRTALDADLAAIAATFAPYQPTTIIVGLPKNMNGTVGPQAEKAMTFARQIENALHVPTVMWDERLSTVAAERTLIAADVSRARRRPRRRARERRPRRVGGHDDTAAGRRHRLRRPRVRLRPRYRGATAARRRDPERARVPRLGARVASRSPHQAGRVPVRRTG